MTNHLGQGVPRLGVLRRHPLQRSDKLVLATGEMFPTTRGLEDEIDGTGIDNVERLGQYVFEMTQAQIKALGGQVTLVKGADTTEKGNVLETDGDGVDEEDSLHEDVVPERIFNPELFHFRKCTIANDTPDIQVASEISTRSDDARKCASEFDIYTPISQQMCTRTTYPPSSASLYEGLSSAPSSCNPAISHALPIPLSWYRRAWRSQRRVRRSLGSRVRGADSRTICLINISVFLTE